MQDQLYRSLRSLLFVGGALLGVACGTEGPAGAGLESAIKPLENGIIDGVRSKAKDYPATGVLLFTTEREDGSAVGSMLCSATLIEPDVIVAAGHCNLALFVDTDAPINYYFSTTLDVAAFGENDDTALPPHTVKVASMVPHPNFSLYRVGPGLGHSNDIALLYLEKAMKDVKPASFIQADEASLLKKGAGVAIVGYGRRHGDTRDNDAGVKYQGKTRINRLGKYEMQISPGAPQPHKCHGDSGGPTYLKIGEGAQARQALIGITSHAYDQLDCLHGGVDTRVDPYLGWISKTLKEACDDGSRPACPTKDE